MCYSEQARSAVLRNLTPEAPPLVNSTPAASRAPRMASTVLYRGNFCRFSKATIVVRDTREAFAKTSRLIPSSSRAALLWSAEMVILLSPASPRLADVREFDVTGFAAPS